MLARRIFPVRSGAVVLRSKSLCALNVAALNGRSSTVSDATRRKHSKRPLVISHECGKPASERVGQPTIEFIPRRFAVVELRLKRRTSSGFVW